MSITRTEVFFGIRDLFRALLQKASYDYVIDVHDHIRTMTLRTLFRLFFTDVIVFRKGRKEKKRFTRRKHKIVTPLPHTVERYREAFSRAGLAFDVRPGPYFHVPESSKSMLRTWLEENQLAKNESEKWIGVAPFAMHTSKIWPLDNYAALFESVLGRAKARFFLFGGGGKELLFFEGLQKHFPGSCVIVSGKLKLQEEIALMPLLDLMVCVDSSNMHLAALSGTRTLSIWGGTHPGVGFAPFGNDHTILQISRDELPCRPCSVYGREHCYVGGFPCQTRISPHLVADEVLRRIG